MLISIKGEELYFEDMNLEINKKINKRVRSNFVIANQTYNKDFLEGHVQGDYGVINSTILVADISYKIKNGHSVRVELQTLKSVLANTGAGVGGGMVVGSLLESMRRSDKGQQQNQ